MKTMKYATMLLSCLSFLTACSNDEEDNRITANVPLEIQLGGLDTRAIIEGATLPMQTSFGIYGTTDDETIMSGIHNISVFYDGKCKLEKNVLLDNTTFHVKAYYPYSQEIENGNVMLNIRDQEDFLYGSATDAAGKQQEINSQNPKADIVFKHALSRITFKVKHTEKIAEDFKFSKIYMAAVPELAWFNIISQTFGAKDFGGVSFELDVPVGKEYSSFELLMVPAEANSDRGIEIHCSNGKGFWVALPEVVWESGQQYTYELIFDDNKITISEAVITAWKTNTEEESEITDDNLVTN